MARTDANPPMPEFREDYVLQEVDAARLDREIAAVGTEPRARMVAPPRRTGQAEELRVAGQAADDHRAVVELESVLLECGIDRETILEGSGDVQL